MLGRDVLVAQLSRFSIRAVENALQLTTEARLCSPTRLSRETSELPLDGIGEPGEVQPGLLKERPYDTFILAQQGGQQVCVVDHRVPPGARQLSSIPQRFLPLYRQSLWSNHSILT
jgi:hypothetical protein